METITKPSLTRLARRAGVKSLADETYTTLRDITEQTLDELIKTILVVNHTKTVMTDDVYDALHLLNYNITKSDDLSTDNKVR